ncbi:hypothetical protein [Microvirga sp. KLBC 81]|uniref:hypothetical protein n=1 Tax=Microvirga sp. KLBC 81 TaxID=1862707 RepID=UPI001FE02A1F|nr:hypothetical protein [Microvirga sp. KLBC 81]
MPERPARTYSPDILPLMQSLLGTLADIDVEFRTDLEKILQSAVEEPLKQRAIATLEKRHHERRAPYVREINKLEKQIQRMFE